MEKQSSSFVRRYKRHLIVVGTLIFLAATFYVVPRALVNAARRASDRANSEYRDGKDGMASIESGRSYARIASWFPGWAKAAKKRYSAFVFDVANGMSVLEGSWLPHAELKQKAIDYLIAHIKDGNAYHRATAERYLYHAGYHDVITTMEHGENLDQYNLSPILAHLFQGKLEAVPALLAKAKPDVAFEFQGLLVPQRIHCLRGDYKPATKLLAVLLQIKAKYTSQKKNITAFRREVGELLFTIECTIRGGDMPLAQRGIVRLRKYETMGSVMALYFEARIELAKEAPGVRDASVRERALKIVHRSTLAGSSLLREYQRFPATMELMLLASLNQPETLFKAVKDLRERLSFTMVPASPKGPSEKAFFIYFQQSFYDNPVDWALVGDVLRTLPADHADKAAATTMASSATLMAVITYAMRHDDMYKKLLDDLPPELAQKWRMFIERLWGDKQWPTDDDDRSRFENKGDQSWRWLSLRWPRSPRFWEVFEARAARHMKHVLQYVILDGSVAIHTVFASGLSRLNYGAKAKLPRLKIWKQDLARWRKIVEGQPNMLLLVRQKI